ncbi:MAG: DUF262 domain-containing HNH endonuclease family protein, partial [Candidatus Taylorbacteria bacterium]|nr:DUF262 domain-containing HNH endonuclease family protein [Candidatus Taylorbacteria bacterium]
ELLEDLKFAMTEKPDFNYFLGSFVFQSKVVSRNDQEFKENDLLDGQQRMTTVLLLFAVIRDLVKEDLAKVVEPKDVKDVKKAKEAKDAIMVCQKFIYQEAIPIMRIPEQTRLDFATKPDTQKFIGDYITKEGGTDSKEFPELMKRDDISIRNLASAVIVIRDFFRDNPDTKPVRFLDFLVNKVLMIYVSTEDLDDAFRLFTILNDRGVPLRNSDILKAINLGEISQSDEMRKYAKMWEEAESELGDDFERFLNHVRTILLKDKSRSSLLKEFEDKIYKPERLHKGKETFEIIEKYFNYYCTLLDGQNSDKVENSHDFDNLIKVMRKGLPATDWMPPLLCYFDKFKYTNILNFLKRLDNKFSADWIGQYPPTYRIEKMNKVIVEIEKAERVDDVFASSCFDIDVESFTRVINGPVYGKGFARYLLLKLDYFYGDPQIPMNVERLSVEHILPQNPAEDSSWVKDFATPEERAEWTHKIGNLVLITGHKDSSLGRLDYKEKKERHFEKNINTCPNSLRVLKRYGCWTPKELADNHSIVLNKIYEHYGILTP